MKSLRILFGILVLAAAVVGGFEFTGTVLTATQAPGGGTRGSGAVTVESSGVETLTFTETVDAVGTTLARQSVTLRPMASGRVAEIMFDSGDRVREGQPLLRLDDAAARAGLAAAQATVAEAQAAFERQERLEKLGSAAEATLQSARAALLRAEAEEDIATNTLNDRVLNAPFDGIVGLTDLAPGQLIDSSTAIATLDDLSVVEVQFSVPERFLARLEMGQKVQLTSPAYPDQVLTGTIGSLDTRVDRSTRSIAMRAEVPNPDGRLKAGMFMRVGLVLNEGQARAVPERALTVAGAQSYVHVAENGTARRIEVTTGRQRDGMIEIVTGLPDDAQVIVTNLQKVSDGSRIEHVVATKVAK